MTVRNRIKELRNVRAGDLLENPKNWRAHPDHQREALASVLDRVGYADALIARETDDGLMLIDGHLRADLDPDQVVPVLVTDLDDVEADTVLATLDPLAAMAERNDAAIAELLGSVDEHLQDIIEEMHEAQSIWEYDPSEVEGTVAENVALRGRLVITASVDRIEHWRQRIEELVDDDPDVQIV